MATNRIFQASHQCRVKLTKSLDRMLASCSARCEKSGASVALAFAEAIIDVAEV
jgi:hypothetical protein